MVVLIVFGGDVSLTVVDSVMGSRDNGPGPLGPTIPTDTKYVWQGSKSFSSMLVSWVVKRGSRI